MRFDFDEDYAIWGLFSLMLSVSLFLILLFVMKLFFLAFFFLASFFLWS